MTFELRFELSEETKFVQIRDESILNTGNNTKTEKYSLVYSKKSNGSNMKEEKRTEIATGKVPD